MRWLMIALLVSVAALLFVAGAVARHVWRHKRTLVEDSAPLDAQKIQSLQLDKELDVDESTELKDH